MYYGWRMLMIAVILAGSCSAAEPVKGSRRSLPVIQVSDSNGVAVNIAEMGNTGNWLLVYVQAQNQSTQSVMQRLSSERFRSYAGSFVIIVGGVKAEELSEWSKQFPELATSRWLADPQHAALRAMNLRGFPVQLGIQENNVEWQLSGAGHENELFEATMLNWLKQTN